MNIKKVNEDALMPVRFQRNPQSLLDELIRQGDIRIKELGNGVNNVIEAAKEAAMRSWMGI